MFGLSSIGTALKVGAFVVALAIVGGIYWYVTQLRSEVATQQQTITNLQASVQVANDAAVESARSAERIASAGAAGQQIVADTHAITDEFTAQLASITKEVDLAPLIDKACTPSGGLPPALLRAADELFLVTAATGGSAGGQGSADPGSARTVVVQGLAGGQPAPQPVGAPSR